MQAKRCRRSSKSSTTTLHEDHTRSSPSSLSKRLRIRSSTKTASTAIGSVRDFTEEEEKKSGSRGDDEQMNVNPASGRTNVSSFVDNEAHFCSTGLSIANTNRVQNCVQDMTFPYMGDLTTCTKVIYLVVNPKHKHVSRKYKVAEEKGIDIITPEDIYNVHND